MIAELKPYPAMKDSGVPWMGKVPEHWEVLALKRLGWFKGGTGFPVEEQGQRSLEVPFFKVSDMNLPGNSSVMSIWNNAVSRSTAATLGATIFAPGTILFPKVGGAMLTNKRRVVERACCIDNNLMACIVKHGNPDFLLLVLEYLDFATIAKPGPVPAISEGEVREIRIALPTVSERTAIVRFIDHVDRRIRSYIRAKQKLIKLLEEQKQAIIHRAVTRGLDPNVRLKPSGVEWLGDIPEHWGIKNIKRLARHGARTFTDGDWIELPYITDCGVRLIQTGNVGTGEYREKGFRYVSENTFVELNCTQVDPNDVLVCRLDGPVGRACLAPDLGCRAITSVDNTILKVRSDVDPRYVVYCLSSPVWLEWIQSLCRAGGGFRYRISRSALGDLRLPVPPLDEQGRIADRLDESLLSNRHAVRREIRTIEVLREYRTRLIADVVTGKLDVREAAARLPDEVEELQPLGDGEAESDVDTDVADDLDAMPEEAEA